MNHITPPLPALVAPATWDQVLLALIPSQRPTSG